MSRGFFLLLEYARNHFIYFHLVAFSESAITCAPFYIDGIVFRVSVYVAIKLFNQEQQQFSYILR